MRSRRLLIVGLLSLVPLFVDAGAAPEATSAALRAAAFERRWPDVVRAFDGIAAPTPEDQYLTGDALMESHKPLDATPHLRAAQAGGFVVTARWASQGWPTIDQLLARADAVQKLMPPTRPPDASPPDETIVVHAGPDTKWSAPVLRALPEFAAVGRSIFGKDLPALPFYLFADRPSFDSFFSAMFGVPVGTSWQDGTGTVNAVLYCEKNAQGRTSRPTGSPEALGCVLHEFGHAWFGTYLMNRHQKEWLAKAIHRPWLDEGMADYVASLREPGFLQRRSGFVRGKAESGVLPPHFEDLASYDGFYKQGDVAVHYWLSALLVEQLLGPPDRGPATIRKLLDEIGRTGDVDAAIKTATGKEPLREFAGVVRRFW